MKKSLMSNIKSFVDSNVRQRIDRVSHNNNDFFTDDLLLVERHFEDIRLLCVDAEKKISTLLQSIQTNNSTSHLGAYTHNVQAGLNSLSQTISHQAANHTTNNCISDSNLNNVQQSTGDDVSQYRSNESLSNNHGNLSTNPSNTQDKQFKHQASAVNDSTVASDHQQLSEDIQQKHKKLPIVGFLRFLVKTSQKLKSDSLLSIAVNHCSHLQLDLAKLFMTYEQTIEIQCLKPIQHILEIDIPNVVKLRKLFIKSHNDLESLKAKYIGASQKQLHHAQQQIHFSSNSYNVTQNSVPQLNANKVDQLKRELDEALMRFEQARDTYEAEIYGFVCREAELVDIIVRLYQLQADYHQQVGAIIRSSLPALSSTLDHTPRKFAFGTALDDHLRCTGRTIAPVLELCVHLLHSQGLKEEGLFRIPGSSIKIKKLKSAINAWFVNLTSLSELESDQSRQTGHSCVIGLHDLFKNVVGKPSESSSRVESSPELDELTTNSDQAQCDNDILLDVHSIAGLLKLYLRELPEPLFTYALYDQWKDALNATTGANCNLTTDSSTSQQLRNEQRLKALEKVILKLPKSNHENLQHLIRFLNLLAQNQQHNKMTSTNLAIAMAPSLIWSKPVERNDKRSIESDASVASQSMSMSSFGIAASMHVMLLDALISNAKTLFQGDVDFSLPGFKELSLKSSKHRGSRRVISSDRPVKSTSPAGFSVASSSSFSSNASNSASSHPNATVNNNNGSTIGRTHSRKGGSMEGLMVKNDLDNSVVCDDMIATVSGELACSSLGVEQASASCQRISNTTVQRGNAFRSTRPVSVQIRREDYATLGHQPYKRPPPVPPVPLARSHQVKQQLSHDSSKESALNNSALSQQKPPAPPVPPPTSSRHKQERLKSAAAAAAATTVAAAAAAPTSTTMLCCDASNDQEQQNTKPRTAPRPISLRGTGSIPSTTTTMIESCNSNNPNSIRPAVPPPERPTSAADVKKLATVNIADSTESIFNKDEARRDNTNSVSPLTISADCAEGDDGKSISPVISLDSLTVASDPSIECVASDSSFDEVDANLLEQCQSHHTLVVSNDPESLCEKSNGTLTHISRLMPSANSDVSEGQANKTSSCEPRMSDDQAQNSDSISQYLSSLKVSPSKEVILGQRTDSSAATGDSHSLSATELQRAAKEHDSRDQAQQPGELQPPVRPSRSLSPKSSAAAAAAQAQQQQQQTQQTASYSQEQSTPL